MACVLLASVNPKDKIGTIEMKVNFLAPVTVGLSPSGPVHPSREEEGNRAGGRAEWRGGLSHQRHGDVWHILKSGGFTYSHSAVVTGTSR